MRRELSPLAKETRVRIKHSLKIDFDKPNFKGAEKQ
jgi:hypothetical protein